MPAAAQVALAVLAAYLLGSVPFAVVVSRAFGIADPRSYGSGNPGATNVLRSGNKKAAVLTLLGDALKGWVAVFLAQGAGLSDTAVGLVALAVFFGHLFPVFLRFRGGKGVATAAGVLLALDWPIGLAVLATWLAVAFASRYSSLAAVVAAAAAPLYVGLSRPVGNELLVVGILALALIGKHWPNIQRLLAGQESRIGGKKKG
ncbi:MAG: glycerol-3-phosphate 1-O-acyltransferase PlsY [Betaproteobacteria bacterium]|jgi:glycerol-3-phosphate acyltransferase PlsY|nr:glycerol-3-phosphate 1-O-acyltransferase PlsY [Betaproteobacteria bacterium]HMW77622.1 glycerol-3-phosphate 1-O-acyltransferase PlsY [Rhodocyclaceae bacterium]HNE42877.1 glycerol-3-phosphate 1-O-acyltransferase PlsY [Rhodocyclaceae bacterium]HNL21136.1 glycerol-3-phosphate 1-O-acyltransferase PlsY [Rhodocyclaceae bacterium]HNM80520.1 glycerol-3-phosphate 1-O-acyltransferase PlsY [Rhodocyclaceae bacterium]